MALTKAKLVEIIAERNSFTKNKGVEVVENLLEIIKRTLENGEDVFAKSFSPLSCSRATLKSKWLGYQFPLCGLFCIQYHST